MAIAFWLLAPYALTPDPQRAKVCGIPGLPLPLYPELKLALPPLELKILLKSSSQT